MKITVHEAFILAQRKLPSNVNVELVLFGDEELNARAILALVDEKPYGLNAMNLIHLGLAKDYAGAKSLIEKARRVIDTSDRL